MAALSMGDDSRQSASFQEKPSERSRLIPDSMGGDALSVCAPRTESNFQPNASRCAHLCNGLRDGGHISAMNGKTVYNPHSAFGVVPKKAGEGRYCLHFRTSYQGHSGWHGNETP
jgi:hypothetical protein